MRKRSCFGPSGFALKDPKAQWILALVVQGLPAEDVERVSIGLTADGQEAPRVYNSTSGKGNETVYVILFFSVPRESERYVLRVAGRTATVTNVKTVNEIDAADLLADR